MIFLSRFSLLQQLKNDNLLQAYIVSIGNKKSPFQEDFNENLRKGLLHNYLLLFGAAIGITLFALLVETTSAFADSLVLKYSFICCTAASIMASICFAVKKNLMIAGIRS